MRVLWSAVAAIAVLMTAGAAAAGPPQGVQSDASFAASYAAKSVRNVSATSQRVSCYRPELAVEWRLGPEEGYLDGGLTPCPGATTGDVSEDDCWAAAGVIDLYLLESFSGARLSRGQASAVRRDLRRVRKLLRQMSPGVTRSPDP